MSLTPSRYWKTFFLTCFTCKEIGILHVFFTLDEKPPLFQMPFITFGSHHRQRSKMQMHNSLDSTLESPFVWHIANDSTKALQSTKRKVVPVCSHNVCVMTQITAAKETNEIVPSTRIYFRKWESKVTIYLWLFLITEL